MSTHSATRAVLGIGLHVEGLHLDRVAVDEHRPVELARDRRLLVGAEIGAALDREALALQDRDRLGVGDARERLLHALEQRHVALERVELDGAA
jgi:hypothetical protein